MGFDDDLASETTRVTNRLHGLLTQIHPSLERVLGPQLQHPGCPLAAGTVRVTGPDPQGGTSAAGHAAATEGAEDDRAGWSRTYSMLWTSRP
ncbi:hypothetical protein [Streptomyces sp. NPDC016675]|uniref:hypothetical protein n=1 Tax=Streptomyces sp. NPDC016675 TaxID=3364970 RepID=UPI003702B06A